jgi:hypothetical protein
MAQTMVEIVMKRILGDVGGFVGRVGDCVQICLAKEGDQLVLYVRTVGAYLSVL